MKKVLFMVAPVALLLSSCSNEVTETFETVKIEGPTPLTVSTYTPGLTRTATATEVSEADVETLQENGFWLSAWDATEDATAMVEGKNFTYVEEAWDSYTEEKADVFYWPNDPTTEVTFYGFYDAGAAAQLEEPTSPITKGNDAVTAEVTSDGTIDYMATKLTSSLNQTTNGTGAIALTFDHILAQVTCQITPGVSGYQYLVGDVTISSPATATYNFDDNTFTDGEESASIQLTEAYVTGGQIATTTTEDGPAGDIITEADTQIGNTVVVVPGERTLSIEYEVNLLDTDGNVLKRSYKTATASFNAVAGKNNVLSITLNPDQVALSVSATVSAWATADAQSLTLETE